MRSAVVDVGSNTLRMLIGEVHNAALSRLCSDRVITRLAEGIGDSGTLGKESMQRSVSAMRSFSSKIHEYGVSRVGAVGTSALRDAANSGEFINTVFRETGLQIEIISGMREAELTSKGVLLGFEKTDLSLLIIDIGGGSTEWILLKPDRTGSPSYGSLNLGVINLLERFLRTDPPSESDLKALDGEIGSKITTLGFSGMVSQSSPSTLRLVGTGGTVTTLASLALGLTRYDPEKVHMFRIAIGDLYDLRDLLLSLPLTRRRKMKGLEPGRADLIIPGILLTIKFMEFFGFHEITVSDYGLLEGLLMELHA
jgi:exopolyphosphatase/guanosine-5'-triphosphate,3'-diphosphate pyrophosphatase